MRRKADDIFHSFNLTDPQQKQFETVKDKFKNYFIVRKGAKFNVGKQEEESDIFITSLYSLAEYCNYGQLKDELIGDRIVSVCGMLKFLKKLQLDVDLTLEKAVNHARQKDAVHGQQSVVQSQIVSENKRDFVKQKEQQQRTVNPCPAE